MVSSHKEGIPAVHQPDMQQHLHPRRSISESRLQQELQQTLQKLNALQELNKKRTKFIETLDLLKDAKEKMQADEEFEAKTFRLDFNKEVLYKSDKLFSISNKSVLLDFVDFLQERIKERVEVLEAQIIEV